MKPFVAMDCVFMLKVFPSGFGPAQKGHVSLYLENQTKEEVHLKGFIQLGKTIEYVDQTLQYKKSVGYSKFIPHPGGVIGDDEDDEDENLAITCHVSEIWKETEFKSSYLITKETYEEVKLLKSTMSQLDSRQTRIAQFVGQTAPHTKLMSVKIEDIGKKLDSQESKLSHVADNVADLTKVITNLKESLIPTNKCELNVDVIRHKTNRVGVNLLGLNNKEDINCVEISNNGDSMMLSSNGEKLIQNISDIKSILIELDKNMKIPSNSFEEIPTSISEGFNTMVKAIGDLDNKFEDFDFDLKAEVKDFFKCLEGTIASRLTGIEAQIRDQENANNHSETTEHYLETIKKDTREKLLNLENFISRISQTNKEQIKHSVDNGYSQQESILKEKFDKIETELKELKRVIETSVLNNENKMNNSIPKPECIGCNQQFDASSKIAQCNLGHLMCWECKERPKNLRCPTCLQPINGRAYGMEHFLSVLLK